MYSPPHHKHRTGQGLSGQFCFTQARTRARDVQVISRVATKSTGCDPGHRHRQMLELPAGVRIPACYLPAIPVCYPEAALPVYGHAVGVAVGLGYADGHTPV